MSGHREGVNKRKFSSIVEVISDENDNDHNDEILAKRPRTPKVGMSDNDNLETNNKPSPVFARKTRPVEEIIVANDGGHEMNNNVDSDIDHDKRQLPRPENTQHIIMDHLVQFFKETNLTLRWFSAEVGESSHRELKNVELRHGLIIKNKKKFGSPGHKKKTTKAGFIFNFRTSNAARSWLCRYLIFLVLIFIQVHIISYFSLKCYYDS